MPPRRNAVAWIARKQRTIPLHMAQRA